MRNHFLRAAVGGLSGGPPPGYDPDVQAWMDARAALSDAVPTAYADAVNQYVLDLKAISGHWDTISQLVVFAGATTVDGALVPIKGLTPTHANLVAGDLDLKTGVKGNTSNKRITTGYDNTSFTQNDCHTYALVTEAPTNGNTGAMIFGSGQAGAGAWSMIINTTSGNSAGRCRNSTADAAAGVTPGGYGLNRSAAANYRRMISDSAATLTRASQTPNASPFLLLCSGASNSSAAAAFSNVRVLVWAIGTATTLENYTTPGADLETALNAI